MREQMLPEHFLERMQSMLGEEYPAFLQSYEQPNHPSLRFNSLKGERSAFLDKQPFCVREVPWEQNGFYYGEGQRPGRHPWHEAGVYYIQEASAMLPATLLDARPGERVLDLCAAPGGKSTQLAARMKGRGILLCNEIHPARARILSENIERMGVANAVVFNESPERLAEAFPEYFDRILVDAPCSGEGMFRKHEEACGQWSAENVERCAARQDEILERAASMLRPGGMLVYSTCTFAPQENEGSIERFLKRRPEWELLPIAKYAGMTDGMGGGQLARTVRLFPHKLEGEGHFAALLRKNGEPQEECRREPERGLEKGLCAREYADYTLFSSQTLCGEMAKRLVGVPILFGEQLYLLPEQTPSLRGLKVLRPGLHLGTLKKNRFEPSHALALALGPQEVRRVWELPADAAACGAYLSGQTFQAQGEQGWYLITVDGYSMGWGKLTGATMKNHYPKGLRKNL